MERLEDRVAVVTGGASGIGLAIGEAFLAEGMRVVLADLDEQLLRTEVERLGAGAHGELVDVGDPASVEALAASTVERFGGVHVIVNNAGIVTTGNSWELPLEDWERVLRVNLWGVIHGIRAFVPRLLATGEEGHVVNTGSLASVLGMAKLGPYTVCKHGVLGLSDVLRAELEALGAPIGVSTVMPGMVRTRLNPIGSLAPSVVAGHVVDAVRTGRRYVFTDRESAGAIQDRLQAILASQLD